MTHVQEGYCFAVKHCTDTAVSQTIELCAVLLSTASSDKASFVVLVFGGAEQPTGICIAGFSFPPFTREWNLRTLSARIDHLRLYGKGVPGPGGVGCGIEERTRLAGWPKRSQVATLTSTLSYLSTVKMKAYSILANPRPPYRIVSMFVYSGNNTTFRSCQENNTSTSKQENIITKNRKKKS